MPTRLLLASLLLVCTLFAACAEPEAPALGTPEGWLSDGDRWWRADADTAYAFRNLDTLADMGVLDTDAGAGMTELALRSRSLEARYDQAVKESLLPLYRNHPEVIDSLFQRHAAPTLPSTVTTGSLRPQVEKQQRRLYKLLRSHFREPLKALELGRDITIVYPDSLRQRGIGGAVRTQVHINTEGEPVAVELLEGVHPVLDALAMRATTEMRWRPAFRLQGGAWIPTRSWTRFSVRFSAE